MRTAEVTYIGNASDLIRANERAKASTAATAAAIAASGKTAGQSYFSMAGAGKKAAAELEGSHSKMASSLAGIHRSSNAAVAGIVAVGAAAYGIKKSADTLGELAKETRALHNVTGLSVQSASAYAAVAKVQDIPVKALNQAFGTLSKNIHAVENAHSGAGKAAKTQETALKQLGLPMSAITKAHGNLDKLLPQVTKRFEEMPGSIAKTQVGMALFGRGWQTLVPIMQKGALGLEEQLKVAKEMGATLSGSTAQQVAQYAKEQEKARYATLGLQVAVGEYLAPALGKLIHASADAVHALGEGVHWLKKHETAALALGGVVGGALSLAFAVFVSSKAKKFIGATKDMVGAMGALKGKIVGDSAVMADSFAGQATAAEAAAVKTARAQEGLAGKVAVADGKIEASNAKASKSFGGILGKLGLVAAAVAAAQPTIQKLTGGDLGETEAEGKRAHNWGGTQKNLDTGGGIMAFFMSKGLSAAQAAGIVGNIQQESGLNPKAAGGGLFQGIGSRANLGRGGAKQQLEAAWAELQGAEKGTLEALRHAKSPQQAARIFSERFERPGKPMLSNREQFAREAFAAHPQNAHTKAMQEHTKAMQDHSKNLGYYESASKKAATSHGAAKHKAAVEGYVDPFSGASGLVRGREDQGIDFSAHPGSKVGAVGGGVIDKVIANWFKGQPLIEERLTSGPMKGKYVYYAEQINAAVREGQRVRAGQAIGTVAAHGTGLELGFGAGGGRTLAQATTGYKEGQKTAAAEAFSKFLSSVGKTGSNIELAGNTFQKAAKQAEHLTLTIAQRAGLHAHVAAAGEEHGRAMGWAGAAGSVGAFLQASQAKWARQKPDLTTAAGRKTAHDRDEQAILTAEAQKKYYQRAVKELQAEAKEWAKIRDSYLKMAKHAKGVGARKEASKKAAIFQGKIGQAKIEAQEMNGNIATAEAAIEEGQTALNVTLPEEIAQAAEQAEQKRQEGLSGDLSAYQAANSKLDLEARAGIITPEQAKAGKEANARKAEAGGYGALSEEGLLQVKGDLREFAQTITEANSALEQHNQLQAESNKLLKEEVTVRERLSEVELSVMTKSLADLISGQIGGVSYQGRAMTPGAGTAARY